MRERQSRFDHDKCDETWLQEVGIAHETCVELPPRSGPNAALLNDRFQVEVSMKCPPRATGGYLEVIVRRARSRFFVVIDSSLP
jgi:hypothetical protein